VDAPAVEEEALGDGGLAGVDVCDDAEVADSIEFACFRHFRLPGFAVAVACVTYAAMRIVGFMTVLLLSPLAMAQDFEGAAKHFGAAQEAFGKQHFHTAAVEFQSAYEVTKDPVLLYNIGEAWQKAGEGKKAVASYKAYLKAQPNAQDKTDVQKRIKMIEGKKFVIPDQSAPGDNLVAQAAPAPAQTAPPPPPPEAPPSPSPMPEVAPPPPPAAAQEAPPPPAAAPAPAEKPPEPSGGLLEDQPVSKMRIAAWIGVAATVATLAAGGIFGLSAQARADDISRKFSFVDANGQPRQFDATAQSDYKNTKDEGELYNDLAIGFFSASGALAVVTVVLFVVDYKHPKPDKRAFKFEPSIGKSSAGVNLGWSF
jgi:hypothetical protein